jgi:TctA family transporter
MYLGNVVGLVIVLTTVPIFAAILRVPFAAVAPMIVVSCAIGAFAIQNAMFDVWLMLASASSATCSRRSASRSRRSRWRWCSATAPRMRSGCR